MRNRTNHAIAAPVCLLVAASLTCSMVSGAVAGEKAVTPDDVESTRDMRFGEFLVVKNTGIEVYNTTGLNDCPEELWEALDVKELAKQFGAKAVQLNGPHFWMMDSQTMGLGEKADFGGIEARYVATLDPAILRQGEKGIAPYTVFHPEKSQKMVYAAGKAVYELVDPEGNTYVLQAHEETFPIEKLGSLGKKMKRLPEGWQYRTRILDEDLVIDCTPDKTIYAVSDEFLQYYTRPTGGN